MIVGLDVSRNVETKRFKGLWTRISGCAVVSSCANLVAVEAGCDDDDVDVGVDDSDDTGAGDSVESEDTDEVSEEVSEEVDESGIGPESTSVTAGYSPFSTGSGLSRDASFLMSSLEAIEFLRILALALLLRREGPCRVSPPPRFTVARSSAALSSATFTALSSSYERWFVWMSFSAKNIRDEHTWSTHRVTMGMVTYGWREVAVDLSTSSGRSWS